MHHLLNLIRKFSKHHRQEFFYNRENEIFRQDFDSLRARAALNHANSL
ncbi:MAG: hypothetical protein M3Q07_07270 [Pseudobdellovibrionaceae bacterium]|nr:hypothetical protein [Pseudobdellovibrionaceae bacterium]